MLQQKHACRLTRKVFGTWTTRILVIFSVISFCCRFRYGGSTMELKFADNIVVLGENLTTSQAALIRIDRHASGWHLGHCRQNQDVRNIFSLAKRPPRTNDETPVVVSNSAQMAFLRIQKLMWRRGEIRLKTKLRVSNAAVQSVWLYVWDLTIRSWEYLVAGYFRPNVYIKNRLKLLQDYSSF